MEEALFGFEIEVVKLSDFENIVDCASVVINGGACGNPNVIHVNSDRCTKGFMFEDDVMVDVIHHSLKCCW